MKQTHQILTRGHNSSVGYFCMRQLYATPTSASKYRAPLVADCLHSHKERKTTPPTPPSPTPEFIRSALSSSVSPEIKAFALNVVEISR